MNRPFRFRYTNPIVGGFVLATILALTAGVFIAGRAQHWFEAVFQIKTVFPPEGTFGLQRGAEVHILGTQVGTVDQILVEEDDSIHAILRVRGDFVRFIRTDSEAVVKRKFGVAGDAFVEITVGRGPPLPMDPVPTVPIRRDTELVEMVTDLVERVEAAVLPAIDDLSDTLREYRALAELLQSEEGDLQQGIAHVRELLRGLEAGEGTAGRLLRDPALAEDLEDLLSHVREMAIDVDGALGQVRRILADIEETTARLPVMAETVEGELRDVPGVLLQGRATLQEAENLMAGLQRHWLLRRYMHPDTPLETLPLEWFGHAEGP